MNIPRGFRIVATLAALAAMPAAGQDLTEVDGLDSREVISDQELDGMRGGYVTDNGVAILFGIQQAVFTDGRLQAVTPQLVLSATGQPVSPSSLARFQALFGGGTGTIQTGSTAFVLPQTIIQNTLDGRTIDAVTVINAAALNLSRIRSMNISSLLTGQLIQSLR